jgi:adenine/guanine phosphoribosyltransferase-like PRPP-binding protein
LRALIGPYVKCRWVELLARTDYHQVRELDPDRFLAEPVPGGRILLLDDTWTTGASAQSAAMALRRAGASSIATVVLGRHINPEFESLWGAGLRPPHAFSIEDMPFLVDSCAVHSDHAVS